MNSEDEQYFAWLYSQVCSVRLRSRRKTYYNLLAQLYNTQFVWFVPNDGNRLEDGLELRREFLGLNGNEDLEWQNLGCSFLEVVIGLCRRLSFEDDYEREPSEWFWILMTNLGLEIFTDEVYDTQNPESTVCDILDRVIYRTYNRDGSGGFFPLVHPPSDQRYVELWYQLNAYMLEIE